MLDWIPAALSRGNYGEKYELAYRMNRIKLVSHCWLEDCLKECELLQEDNYNKSANLGLLHSVGSCSIPLSTCSLAGRFVFVNKWITQFGRKKVKKLDIEF